MLGAPALAMLLVKELCVHDLGLRNVSCQLAGGNFTGSAAAAPVARSVRGVARGG